MFSRQSVQKTLRDQAPFALASLVLLAMVAWLAAAITRNNDGHFIYALDDAYIHLAIAKQLATSGTWGLRPGQFTPAASSLIWPVVLAAGWRERYGELIPLIINLIAAIGLLYGINRLLSRYGLAGGWRFLMLIVVIIAAPLPPLILAGMEHVLQIGLVVWFCFASLDYAFAAAGTRSPALIALLAGLNTVTRFEGLFVVAVAVLVLMFRRRWAAAGLLTLVAWAPIALFGLFSLNNGWFFLPASVVSKTNLVGSGGIQALLPSPLKLVRGLQSGPLCAILLLLNGIVLIASRRIVKDFWRDPLSVAQLMAVGATLLHASYASFGWFHRYEAYLLVLNLLTLTLRLATLPGAASAGQRRLKLVLQALSLAGTVIILIGSLPFLSEILASSSHIYRQQYQTARFLRSYYPQAAVVLNDIGTVSYYNNNPFFDLWGLGSKEPTLLIRSHAYDAASVQRIAIEQGSRLAVVHPVIFGSYIPDDWRLIGTFVLDRPTIGSSETVGVYAMPGTDEAALRANFAAFAATLPTGVEATLAPAR